MSERTTTSDGPMDGAAYLGEEIRYCRDQAGMSQQQLADATHYQRPYVTRVEKGTLLASAEFADACDRIFKTAGHIGRLRRKVSERGHPDWFIPYLKLEREAESICDYSNAFIMGMLQTPEYAEAVFRAAHPRETTETIKSRVDARMQRRAVMEKPSPPLLWVIIHESVLRTVVGGSDVMRTQLAHLVAEADSPHIVIQVYPFNAGAPASGLPFVMLEQPDGSAIRYSEIPRGGHVEDSPTAVAKAQARYDRLRAAGLSPDSSRTLIHEVMEELAHAQHA